MAETAFSNDAELFAFARQMLYVPVVCDVLDGLGYRQQAMHQRLRPLDPNACTIVGRARTFRWMDTDYVVEYDGLRFRVVEIEGSRIEKLEVQFVEPPPREQEDDQPEERAAAEG